MDFLLTHGSLYKIVNGNLLLHACVPLAPDGSLLEVTLFGETYRGRALYDMVDASVRAAFLATDEVSADDARGSRIHAEVAEDAVYHRGVVQQRVEGVLHLLAGGLVGDEVQLASSPRTSRQGRPDGPGNRHRRGHRAV